MCIEMPAAWVPASYVHGMPYLPQIMLLKQPLAHNIVAYLIAPTKLHS